MVWCWWLVWPPFDHSVGFCLFMTFEKKILRVGSPSSSACAGQISYLLDFFSSACAGLALVLNYNIFVYFWQ